MTAAINYDYDMFVIGEALMSLGGNIDCFVDPVLNYRTLAEYYKIAALDGINRLA